MSLVTLTKALAKAETALERACIHEALAVYWGQHLEYRKMNHHELASAEAHGEFEPSVASALAQYDRGVAMFEEDKELAIELVRGAQQTLLEKLGTRHPQVIQATHTLAGRLRQFDGRQDERFVLYQQLLEWTEQLYGSEHVNTFRLVATLAYFLRTRDEPKRAILEFERAFDGLIQGPAWGEAAKLLGPLAELCRKVGTPTRTANRELAVCARGGSTTVLVRWVRLWRIPELRKQFNRDAILHVAHHFDQLAGLIMSAFDDPAMGRQMLAEQASIGGACSSGSLLLNAAAHQLTVETKALPTPDLHPDRAATMALQALEHLDEEQGTIVDSKVSHCHDAEYEWADAEYDWQQAHFDALWMEHGR